MADLIALQRSAAMLEPHAIASVRREELLAVLDELIALRQLVERFGTDMRHIAKRGR